MRSRQMDDFIAKFVSCACNRLLKIRSIVFIKYVGFPILISQKAKR